MRAGARLSLGRLVCHSGASRQGSRAFAEGRGRASVTPVRLDFRFLGVSGWVDVAVEPKRIPKRLQNHRSQRISRSVPLPSRFFGFAPVLFDATARPSREDLDWSAETFLCFVPMEVDRREARAILGFSWGFSIREAARLLACAPDRWNNGAAADMGTAAGEL